MKTLCIDEVLRFYRQSHSNCVLLFRVGSYFVAYDEDAVALNKLLSDTTIESIDTHKQLKFPDYQLEDVIQRLVQNTLPVYWVEYRDDNGKFVLPKVKQILEDMEEDY